VIKPPSRAAFLCPWKGGIPQGATEGGAVMPMEGRIPQEARNG